MAMPNFSNSTTLFHQPNIYDDFFGSGGLYTFSVAYGQVHIPLVMFICLFGIGANVINVVILWQKNMRQNATNVLLAGLAPAQLALLVNFILFTVYSKFLDTFCNYKVKTYDWLFFLLLNVNFNLIFHTIALTHTCFLAIFRYLVIHFPMRSLVTISTAKKAVLSAYVCVPLFCASFFFNSEISRTNLTAYCPEITAKNPETYMLRYRSDTPGLTEYHFWFFAIIGKILPCLCLVILSVLLSVDLRRAQKVRSRLKTSSTLRSTQAQRQHVMTSVMLVIIVILFVLVEFPQGILNVLSAILGDQFRYEIYLSLGDFFDMLTVLYSSLNFVLYCTMSSQFRTTFRKVFCRKISAETNSNPRRFNDYNYTEMKTVSDANANHTMCSSHQNVDGLLAKGTKETTIEEEKASDGDEGEELYV